MRHMGAVNIARRQGGCHEMNKKPRQVNLGNTDLIFSFVFLLLEMALRYKQ